MEGLPRKELLADGFASDMEEFFDVRKNGVDLAHTNIEYQQLGQELEKIEEYFLEKLPDKKTAKAQINSYSDLCANMEGVAMDIFYRKGFADGVKFILRLMSF